MKKGSFPCFCHKFLSCHDFNCSKKLLILTKNGQISWEKGLKSSKFFSGGHYRACWHPTPPMLKFLQKNLPRNRSQKNVKMKWLNKIFHPLLRNMKYKFMDIFNHFKKMPFCYDFKKFCHDFYSQPAQPAALQKVQLVP